MLEHIDYAELSAYNCGVVVRYGERFRLLRDRAELSQEDVARLLNVKHGRGSSVSNIEKLTLAPARSSTVLRHATALRCKPWELMAGVATRFDQLRVREPLSDEESSALAWGLALLPKAQREVALMGLQTFVEQLPRAEVPPQALRGTPATLPKASLSSRKTRRA